MVKSNQKHWLWALANNGNQVHFDRPTQARFHWGKPLWRFHSGLSSQHPPVHWATGRNWSPPCHPWSTPGSKEKTHYTEYHSTAKQRQIVNQLWFKYHTSFQASNFLKMGYPTSATLLGHRTVSLPETITGIRPSSWVHGTVSDTNQWMICQENTLEAYRKTKKDLTWKRYWLGLAQNLHWSFPAPFPPPLALALAAPCPDPLAPPSARSSRSFRSRHLGARTNLISPKISMCECGSRQAIWNMIHLMFFKKNWSLTWTNSPR